MNFLNATKLTMTSREIAACTGKEHSHVLRDIERMLAELDIEREGYLQNWIHPQNGQTYREFALTKDLTLTLVTGYSATLRKAIIDRWSELESGASAQASHQANPTTITAESIQHAVTIIEMAKSEVARLASQIRAMTSRMLELDAALSGEAPAAEPPAPESVELSQPRTQSIDRKQYVSLQELATIVGLSVGSVEKRVLRLGLARKVDQGYPGERRRMVLTDAGRRVAVQSGASSIRWHSKKAAAAVLGESLH